MKFYNLESEQIVLSAILLNETYLLKCNDSIRAEVFYDDFFREIYNLIIKSYKKYNSLVVPSAVTKIIKDKKLSLEMKEKCSFLIKRYKEKKIEEIEFKIALENIKEMYVKRLMLEMSDLIVSNLESKDIHTLYSFLEDTLINTKVLISPELISKEGDIKDVEERLKIYKDIKADPNKFKGILSGWNELDLLTGGFQPGELILLIGKQGGGKSMGLLNIGFNAWKQGKNVVYFTLEMPKLQIERRFDSLATSTQYYKIKTGEFTDDELENFELQLKKVFKENKSKFYIVDVPANCDSVLISSKIKQLSRKFPVGIIIIDYLGLIASTTKNKEVWQSTLQVANDLKEVARSFNIPLVTASQVTTEGIKKKIKDEYDLSDIALTRRLADPCDIVLGLKWDEAVNQMYINIIKYRDGRGPVIKLFADLDRCLITNLSYGIENEAE